MNASLQLFIYLSTILKDQSSSLGGDHNYVQHLISLLHSHAPELLDPADPSSHYPVLVGSFSLALGLVEAHNAIVKNDLIHTLQWVLSNEVSSKTLLEARTQEILNLKWTCEVLKSNTEINTPTPIQYVSPIAQAKVDMRETMPITGEDPSPPVSVKETSSYIGAIQQAQPANEHSNQDVQAFDHSQSNENRTIAGAPMEVHDLKDISDSFDKNNQR